MPKPRSELGSANIKQPRKSVFKEEGLNEIEQKGKVASSGHLRPRLSVRFRSKVEVLETADEELSEQEDWSNRDLARTRIQARTTSSMSTMPRLFLLAFVLAIILPTLNNFPNLKGSPGPIGAKAGPIDPLPLPKRDVIDGNGKRQSASSDYCKRWSQQSALVNGTLYLYGGRTTTDANQKNYTWSMNNVVSIGADELTGYRQRLFNSGFDQILANLNSHAQQ